MIALPTTTPSASGANDWTLSGGDSLLLRRDDSLFLNKDDQIVAGGPSGDGHGASGGGPPGQPQDASLESHPDGPAPEMGLDPNLGPGRSTVYSTGSGPSGHNVSGQGSAGNNLPEARATVADALAHEWVAARPTFPPVHQNRASKRSAATTTSQRGISPNRPAPVSTMT